MLEYILKNNSTKSLKELIKNFYKKWIKNVHNVKKSKMLKIFGGGMTTKIIEQIVKSVAQNIEKNIIKSIKRDY